MLAPRINLTLNEPRQELLQEGWSRSRVASSLQAARLSTMPGPNNTTVTRYLPADFPHGVWKAPDTGFLLMRPSALRDDFAESPDYFNARIPLSALTFASGVVPTFDEPAAALTGKPKLITLQRDDPNVDVPSIAAPAWAWAALTASSPLMTFTAATVGTLAINEGFTMTVQPSGLATDRAEAWLGLMFGDRYYLLLGMNGSAAIWEYRYPSVATGSPSDWVRRERFEYTQGGVDHTKAFQVTVLPWGIEFISLLFSQAAQPSQEARAATTQRSTNTYTHRLSLGIGELPRFDQAHGHYVKIEPAPLRIAMRRRGHQYAFALARLRYPPQVEFIGLPEQLTEPKGPMDVMVTPIGFYPGGSHVARGRVNEDGAVWDPPAHVRFAPTFALQSGGGGMYTPELWGVEYDVHPRVHVTPTTAHDLSPVWSSLRWRESNHPDSSDLTIVMRRNLDWQNLLKLDGLVTLRIDGVERFQGYIEQSRPHFDGLPFSPMSDARAALGMPRDVNLGVPLRDQPVVTDHWGRLADTDAANFRSLTRRSIGEVFEEGLHRAGYTSGEIAVSPEVHELSFGGFERANDWRQPQEDTNVADLFRRIIETYGAQNRQDLRCVRRRGAWRVYLSRSFDPAAQLPGLVFMLDDRVFFPQGASDAARWSAAGGPYLKVFTQPEVYVRRPEFNELRCFTTDEPNETAVALAAFIAAHPRTLTDPTFHAYEGRIRAHTMGSSACGHLSTQNEIERFARRVYDSEYRKRVQWTHAAEWHPNVEPDQFAWVVGRGPDAAPVSYGVWRVEEVEVSLETDNVPLPPDVDPWRQTRLGDRQFTWEADYTLAWEAPYSTLEVPMFSWVHP